MTRSLQTLCGALMLALACSASAADALKVLKKVPPDFPAEAARKGITDGVLKASLAVDGAGSVTDVTIVEASPAKAKIFSEAAIEALKKWKFEGTGKASTFELKLVFQQE
jgi:TonB family protein